MHLKSLAFALALVGLSAATTSAQHSGRVYTGHGGPVSGSNTTSSNLTSYVGGGFSQQIGNQTFYSGRANGGPVSMHGLTIGNQTFYSGRANGGPVSMHGLTIGNQTFYSGRANGGPVSGSSYQIGNQTFFHGRANGRPVNMPGLTIGNQTFYSGN